MPRSCFFSCLVKENQQLGSSKTSHAVFLSSGRTVPASRPKLFVPPELLSLPQTRRPPNMRHAAHLDLRHLAGTLAKKDPKPWNTSAASFGSHCKLQFRHRGSRRPRRFKPRSARKKSRPETQGAKKEEKKKEGEKKRNNI